MNNKMVPNYSLEMKGEKELSLVTDRERARERARNPIQTFGNGHVHDLTLKIK